MRYTPKIDTCPPGRARATLSTRARRHKQESGGRDTRIKIEKVSWTGDARTRAAAFRRPVSSLKRRDVQGVHLKRKEMARVVRLGGVLRAMRVMASRRGRVGRPMPADS
jgi:hypothetical protein